MSSGETDQIEPSGGNGGANDETGSVEGRRARNRVERTERFLAAAAELIDANGLEGLTMASVADAASCAVGTIYTYFPSKSALVAELQRRAIEALHAVAVEAQAGWDAALAGPAYQDLDDQTRALTRVLAYGRLLLIMPVVRPREYQLQTQILTMRGTVEELEDARTVSPSVLATLDQPRSLLDDAVQAGALTPPPEGDASIQRTIRWTSATLAMLLLRPAERVVPDVVVVRRLVDSLIDDMLLAWGADAGQLAQARAAVERLTDDRVLARV